MAFKFDLITPHTARLTKLSFRRLVIDAAVLVALAPADAACFALGVRVNKRDILYPPPRGRTALDCVEGLQSETWPFLWGGYGYLKV